MRGFVMAAAVASLTGAAAADVPPPPPDHPIPEACKPLMGIWARTAPQTTRWADNWDLLVVDAQHATKVTYMDQRNGVNVEAQTALFNIDCRVESDGQMTVSLDSATDEEGSAGMLIKLSGAGFTTQEETTYNFPGPPPEGWTPEMVVVTYRRIVPAAE